MLSPVVGLGSIPGQKLRSWKPRGKAKKKIAIPIPAPTYHKGQLEKDKWIAHLKHLAKCNLLNTQSKIHNKQMVQRWLYI